MRTKTIPSGEEDTKKKHEETCTRKRLAAKQTRPEPETRQLRPARKRFAVETKTIPIGEEETNNN